MSLLESEKRDLIKLIEENKPLPAQYRFKLFEKSDEIELLWNGKNNEITNVNLPFQIIEHVDEPRKNIEPELQGNLFDTRGRKQAGWTNKLIWGNNSLVLSSLINGPLREEIEEQGGLKLVYIDPPSIREGALAVGASKVQSVMHHVVPLAMPGTLSGTIIGLAQALGETAPLLLIGMVAFVVQVPGTPMDPSSSLPVQVYLWSESAERGFVEKTSATIMMLLGFLIAMNSIAVYARQKFEKKWI